MGIKRRGAYQDIGNASTLGAPAVLDASKASVFRVTLNQANTQFAITNLVDGDILIVELLQDATGGRTATFNGAGGMTITNPPTIADGPNRVATLLFAGANAQGGSRGTFCGSAVNGETTNSYLSAANGYVTLANDAATSPNGASIDVLTGDALRFRIGGNTYLTIDDFVGGCRINTGALATYFYGGIVQFQSLANVNINAQAASFISLNIGATERMRADATGLGFFAAAPVAKPTGVAVTAAAIHAALVSLGLIAA